MHLRPTAADIRPQVEDQGGAYQTEAEAPRHERNQHSGCEARKDNEGTAPRHPTRTLGDLRGVRACQYLAFEDRPRQRTFTPLVEVWAGVARGSVSPACLLVRSRP